MKTYEQNNEIIAILYNKEEIQEFLKYIKLPACIENFFLTSNKIYFIDNGFGSIKAKRFIDFEDEGFNITLLSLPNLYHYILFYNFERKIPTCVILDYEDFAKLQADFLKSDAFHGEFSNYIEVDNAFIHYQHYEDIEFKLDENLNYITFTDGWMPEILVPYDCDLFWWLYKKLFKGEN